MKAHGLFSFVLALVLSTIPPKQSIAQNLQTDSLALVAIYNSTNGPGWFNNTNWLTGPVGTWYGVTLNPAQTRVQSLNFNNNNLDGTLPPEIGNLSAVVDFVAGSNSLIGVIPYEIGGMLSLYQLAMPFNQLSGPLPGTLFTIQSLQFINFFVNNLSGTVSDSISMATNLVSFNVDFNQITGDIPASITSLQYLNTLNASNNLLDNLPGLTSAPSLLNMNIYNNRLTFEDLEYNVGIASINYSPQDSIGDLVITSVYEGNSFSIERSVGGTANQYQWFKDGVAIPGETNPTLTIYPVATSDAGVYHVEITNTIATDLTLFSRTITLSTQPAPPPTRETDSLALVALYNATDGPNWNDNSNWLTGPLHTWNGISTIGFGGRVYRVDLSEGLDGHLPAEIGFLTAATHFNVPNNNLTGPIPAEIGNLTSATTINLMNNQLTGNIPYQIFKPANLEYLYFNDNQLVGEIPDSIGLATSLKVVYFTSNQFTGDVPSSINNLTSLQLLAVNNNDFVNLPNLSSLPSIVSLGAGQNKLTFEDIEPNVGITNFYYDRQDSVGEKIDTVLMEGINFSIDRTIGGTANQYQWFKDGLAIPGETNPTLNLNPVVAGDAGVYHLEVTNTIAIDDPIFSNTITLTTQPNTLTDLQRDSLALIALYNATDGPNWTDNSNWLTGPLETWYGVMLDASGTRVQTLQLTPNNLTGQIPPEVGQLSALWTFNLSLNDLTGPIPSEIVGMQNVSNFFLGLNNLSGPIPNELWTLPNLSIVGLLGNNISGELSDSISLATNLFQLVLDQNQISGDIPTSITTLPSLTYLYLTDNEIENIPDMSSMSNLDQLNVHTNRLTFEDLQPNLGINTFNYDPQRNFGEIQDTTIAPGSTFTVNRSLPEINNQYQWFKDGVSVSGQNSSTLNLISFTNDDIGTYHVEVMNPNVPNLTISSNPINVYSTNPPPTPLELDSLALVAFYNATDGPNWTNNSNWLTGPVDSWNGIGLDGGRVTSITLFSNNLSGTLPLEITNLTDLQVFNLADNNLSGPLPGELGLITSLEEVYLQTNNFTGTIPGLLFSSSLTDLVLAYNNLTGVISDSVSNATSLEYFDVTDNEITSIPDTITSLPNLAILSVYANKLEDIPDMSSISSLHSLYTGRNLLAFDDLEPNMSIPLFEYSLQAFDSEILWLQLVEGDSIYLDRTLGGSANQYQWVNTGVPILGQNSPILDIPSVVLADSGYYAVQVTSPLVPGLTITSNSVLVDVAPASNCQGNYSITESGITCATPFFSVPIVASNAVGAGIIGLNFCLTYDTAMVTPTGGATIGDVVTGGDPSIADFYLNTGTPGQVDGLIFFNGNAPFPSYVSGVGEIITLEFEYDSDINPDDELIFHLCGVTESTLASGDSTHCNESDFTFSVENESVFVGTLEFWGNGGKTLIYDSLNPGAYIATQIQGTDSACVDTGSGIINPDLNGEFIYNTADGENISIDRDIPGSFTDTTGCTNMMPWINGTDQNRTMKIATNDVSYTPNVYAIMAADVNRDGQVNAADVTLIAARSVMNICGFTPDGITSSEDWIFIDETTLTTDPQYQISATYPTDDGVGFSRSNVPGVDDCLPVPTITSGLCTETFDETYVGILLGDVNGNWKTVDGANSRTQETQLLSFDFDNMYEEDGYYFLNMVINPSEFEALDFFFSYNVGKMNIENASQPQSEFNIVHNAYGHQFLYSSYAMEKTSMFGPFMTLKISASSPPTAEDFVQGYVYMDDEQMSITSDLIEVELSAEDWMIYPNPFTDQLFIQYFGDVNRLMEMNLYNTSGKMIYTSGETRGDSISRLIELNNIKPGIYFLEIRGGSDRVVRKLIKQ